MNNDEKFINDVWFKYNSYKQYIVKDTFFKKFWIFYYNYSWHCLCKHKRI